MRNWLVRQYNDIKGNFKWAVLAAFWWLAAHFGKKLLQMIPNIPGWMVTSILFCLSVAVFLWLAKSGRNVISQPSQSSRAISPPGIPTLSALQGQAPQVNFNAHEWFRVAYYSPLTAEIENNIKIAANNNQPNDREGFYARLIGVGMIAYFHDMTWAYIFKSQLLTLAELNRRVMISASDAKAFYDKAVMEYPRVYANYSFDQWLNYMKTEQLLIQHPSNMLEITHRGKDLLRYLAHWGRDAAVKTG